MAAFAPPAAWTTTTTFGYWTPASLHWRASAGNTAGFWMPAPAAVTQPVMIRGLALARRHLALLARPTPPEPPDPLEAAPVAPQLAVATVREHRLRHGSRRRARPKRPA